MTMACAPITTYSTCQCRSRYSLRAIRLHSAACARQRRSRPGGCRRFQRGSHLSENRRSNDGRGRGQQGEHRREGCARQPRHGQLIADVGDNRRRDAYADPRQDQGRLRERGDNVSDADRHRGDQRDEHRRSQPVNPARAAGARNGVADHDINSKQRRVGDRKQHTQPVARPLKADEQKDADDRDDECGDISERPHADKRYDDRRDELDRRDGRQRHAVDREIKRAVHQRQCDPERADQRPGAPIAIDQNAPRTSPSAKTRPPKRSSTRRRQERRHD